MARPRRLRIGAALLALTLAQSAVAQAPAPTVTSPAVTMEQAPPAATIQQTPPAATLQQAPAPGTAMPPPAVANRPTLVPDTGDTSNVDEVILPEKPVLILSGSSPWEDGLKNLRAAFGRIEAELARIGIAPAGRPLAVFVQTTDESFRFDAMVPIGAAPNPAPAVPAEMRFGTTPSGKAYRFVHKGSYDDIDTTYETITTYLDAKDILAKDAFVEEYVSDLADASGPGIEVNIFVQPR